jgi:hypothetical protein
MWTRDGSNFAVSGTAETEGSGWRYTEKLTSPDTAERCAVSITHPAKEWRVATEEGARCEIYAGHNAVLYGTLKFPDHSRVSTAAKVLASPDGMMSVNCGK